MASPGSSRQRQPSAAARRRVTRAVQLEFERPLPQEQLEQLADLVADRIATRQLPSLVDAGTAAALLGVPASWVLSEARANRIPHVRLGKYVRFEPERLTEWWTDKEQRPI